MRKQATPKTKTGKPTKTAAAHDALRPDPRNARRHPERNKGMIRDSLQEVGAGRSILVDGENIIRAGNGVYEQAQALGLTVRVIDAKPDELIAVRRPDLKGKRAIRAALLDNRAGETSEWDVDVLAEMPADLIGNLFTDKELKALGVDGGGGSDVDAEPQIDRAKELRKKWGVETGQLWQLGDHRLICGDCTDKVVVDRVMGGEKAAICFTSPPYNAGVSAQLSGNTSIDDNLYKDEYDDNKSRDEYLALLRAFTGVALSVCKYVFVNIQPLAGNKRALVEYWAEFVDRFADVAIWDKGRAAPARARRVMDSRFEFVIVFSHDATRAIGTREFCGMVHNVYSGSPQKNNEFSDMHAATFPVDLPAHFIEAFTNSEEVIYEPFSGTATTIIAAEQLKRRCRAVEISPAYVAVALERWADATGKTPELIDDSRSARSLDGDTHGKQGKNRQGARQKRKAKRHS